MGKRKRFKVVVEEGTPHGGLYELEQTIYYHIVEVKTKKVVATFEEELDASLSYSEPGTWRSNGSYGVSSVTISDDEEWIDIIYHHGKKERIATGDLK